MNIDLKLVPEILLYPSLSQRVTRPGSWSGLAPDGTPLFVRDTSTQEIYALDVQFP
jgi:hypothetical protein